MDPNANLEEQLRLAKEIDEALLSDVVLKAYRLAELVLALHEWISKGGCLPDKWRKN